MPSGVVSAKLRCSFSKPRTASTSPAKWLARCSANPVRSLAPGFLPVKEPLHTPAMEHLRESCKANKPPVNCSLNVRLNWRFCNSTDLRGQSFGAFENHALSGKHVLTSSHSFPSPVAQLAGPVSFSSMIALRSDSPLLPPAALVEVQALCQIAFPNDQR